MDSLSRLKLETENSALSALVHTRQWTDAFMIYMNVTCWKTKEPGHKIFFLYMHVIWLASARS